MANRVVIIDYEMGNVKSVANAFQAMGADVCLSNKEEEIITADRIVLPGVGAFGEGMNHLRDLKIIPVLERAVKETKKPFLGICLGMQLLASRGFEFGQNDGLGWIPGDVTLLETGGLPLPHVGWNDIHVQQDSPLVSNFPKEADFYFVHSFHFSPVKKEAVIATCDYGTSFAAIVGSENIYGAQFHPEKSQKAGRLLLERFLAL